MTEVWKSVPKKFCEICKCWYYDNKVSVQHHEQGRRHQENVKNKLRELGKKGREQEHEDRAKFSALVQMERGALAAYKRDVKEDTRTAAAYNIHMNLAALPIRAAPSLPKRPRLDGGDYPSTSTISDVLWYEAKIIDNDSGAEVSYYWNIQTGETVWELPAGEAFVSLVQQKVGVQAESEPSDQAAEESSEKEAVQADKESEDKRASKGQTEVKSVGKKAFTKPKKETSTTCRMAIKIGGAKRDNASKKSEAKPASAEKELPEDEDEDGDVNRGRPFGDWQPVEVEESKKDEFAYLPHNQWVKTTAAEGQTDIAVLEEDPKEKITFAERTAPSLTSNASMSASCTFKKRKAPASGRNIRNRDD